MKKIFTLCVVLCMTYLSMGATNLKHEFRATWLTTAWGNDWPKAKVTNDATRKQQQDSLIAIFDRLQAGNMNAVCLQVRGRSDAFYQSSYEPWAAELAGARGTDPGYDPLAFAIEEAHKRGLELHAWVNPFRVTSSGTLSTSDKVWLNAGQWIIQYNNGSFSGQIIDPGYPEAREYVLNVLMEIVNNYDIDGIVMDDYFYPYGGTTTEDAASKALYKPNNVVDVNQDGDTDDDWRRSNVDVFLEELYNQIQATKPWVRFGMGTFGIWTTQTKVAQAYGISLPSGISGLDDYDEQACNPVEWVKNGYVDYINPQLYWPTTSTGQNYNKLCHWWAKDVCEHFSNQLTNGKKVHFFSSQSISANPTLSEIQSEIDVNRNNLSSGSTGSVFFDTDAYLTMDKDLMTSRFATNALTPPMDWKSNTALAAPTNLTVSGSTLTWQHPTAERFTVYVYPKGTAWSTAKNDPSYLQGVIYGNSMDISGIDTNMNDIAVCAYDRFGVEHTAAVYSNDSGAGTTPNPETIIWELNGGEVNTVTVEVPSLTTLEAQFKNDYNSYFGAAVATTREITNFLYYGSKEESGSNLVYNMMNDPVADWTWLRDYIISKSASNTTIQTALLAGTDAHWRYSIVAFLTASAGTNSTYTVDFSTAGQPSKWGTAYQIAHGAVLLPTYVTSAYTLPTPVHPSGYEFLGWYDNAEFTGSSLTTIPAGWTGTLYAKWNIIDPTWQIRYTSTDGNIVTPYKTDVFGANIVSNIYENGVGTITFDGPVTSIGDGAFTLCASLTTVTIGNSVTSIGDNAFDFCAALSSITIPNSVTSIGDEAFTGCSSLTSITIPSSVTHIGVRAFSSHSIESIVVDSENATYDSRNNCNAIIEKATNSLIAGCQKTIIPNSVTSIGKMAFYNCSSLASITIPNSIKSISSSAFYGCSSLTSLTIPNSVTSIEKEAFHACSSLTSITIPNSVTSIGEWVFYDCSSLTSITIPESVTNIGNSAFYGCSSIASITIPESVTSIGKKAFDKCSSLDTIYVEATTPPALGENVFASSPVCHIPCGTLATYESSAWARQVGGFVGDCPPASAAITYVLNGGVQSEWETPQAMYNELNALWNTFSGTSKTWGDLSTLKADVAKGIPTLAYGMALDFIADENFKEKFEWLVTYMDAKCTEQGQTLPSSNASFLRYNLQAFFIDGMRISWPISADYTICGVSTVEAYQPYWKSGFANPTNPTEEFVLNAPYKEGYTFAGWYTTPDFSGEKVTTVNSETTGTLYAKWIDETWVITYTSTNDSIVTPYNVNAFDANIVSNIYENGVGTITFDGPVTSIGENAFRQCSSIASITIPKSVKSIGEYAFSECSYLSSITILDSVTRIGDWAFSFCMTLTSVTIHDSVTSIGEGAFWHCNGLTSITIPSSVTNIGYGVFGYCYNLASLVIEEGNTIYDSRDNCNAIIETTTNTLISGCQNTIILNNVTSIGAEAFYGCSSLTSIILPNSVTNIGEQAFANCSGLTSITLPNSVMNIGDQAFVHCSRLDSITLPNSVTSIGEMAFLYCSSLDTIHVEATTPPALEDSTVFMNTPAPVCVIPCGTLAAYEASDWASQVGSFMEDCVEGQQIYYTSTDGNIVTPYKTNVFGANIVSNTYKNGVGTITFDGPVTTIGNNAFYECSTLTSITIPDSVTSIDWSAFEGCSYLTSITIPNSVISIGNRAFQSCSSITSITIPNSVTSIGDNVFYGCKNLTSITIPNSVISIGNCAFQSCSSITSITIPNSVTSIGSYAFHSCCSLSSIVVESGNTIYDSRDNCNAIIKTATNSLIAGCPNTIIPNSVTRIGDDAFAGRSSLVSITIPNSVTSIGSYAFYACTSLTSISIPNSVTSIGGYAFTECSSLTYISIPNSVTSIGVYAFSECSSLTSITVPNSVTSIGKYVFRSCSSLDKIYVKATTPPILEEGVFEETPASICYIPCGTFAAYEATNWANQVGKFIEEGCAPPIDGIVIFDADVDQGNAATDFNNAAAYQITKDGVTVDVSTGCLGGTVNSMHYRIYMGQTLTITSTVGNIAKVEFTCTSRDDAKYGPGCFTWSAGDYTYSGAVGTWTGDTCEVVFKASTNQVRATQIEVTLVDKLLQEKGITYELNGGLPNEYGWQNKNDMFQACMADCGVTTLPSLDEIKATGNDAALTTICTKLTDVSGMLNSDKWEWLEQYIMEVQNAQVGNVVGSSFVPAITTTSDAVYWRYALAAFFVDGQRTAWPYSADFSQAGMDEAYIPAWKQVYTYPTSVTSEFTLYDPYRKGYTFLGWYTNADFSGEKVTTINAETTGTLYAKWINNDWIITYTSTDGNIVTPYATDAFGANIVSNTYENGVGTITFDGPVTSIGENAFYRCSGLTSVTIPNSVTSIGYYAFDQCISITSITIPNSVTSIGDNAFKYCSSLTSMVVEPGNTTYDSRENCNAIIEKATNTLIAGCQNTVIPNSVTSIGERAFEGCSSLTSITIPNSVVSIGDRAFAACTSLTSITIPNSVTSIGDQAFLTCTSLASITIPNNVMSIGYMAFHYCTSLASITIPNSVTSIGDWAFGDCSSLTSITIPNSVTSIGTKAFAGCTSLTSITIPNSVDSIGHFTFLSCSSLTSITIPNSVTSIGFKAFKGCTSLTSITIPNSVTSIGGLAFDDCTSLTSITCNATTPPTLVSSVFPSELTTAYIPCGTKEAYEASDWANQVGEFVEEGCAPIQMCGDDLYWEYADGLLTITGTGEMYDYAADTDVPWYDVRGNIKTVSLPDAMTKIGQNAFYKCTAMTTINMPTSLTAIGEKAFAQDTKLACEIILPASMTTIASRAFFNCQAVTAFHIEATTPPTIPNDAFERTTAPIHVPCGYGHVYGKHTRWGMLNLEMCELLQDNVYYYPIDGHTARAVTYHSNPTDTIVIPSAVVIDGMPRTVTEVADFAFTDCDDLPAIYFSEGLEYIGERAFVRCYGLQGTIVLPATLETIGERAFSYCDNVEKYLIQAMTPPALGDGAFTCANHDALFYVSCEVMDDYKVATNWSSLKSRLRDACLNIYHYNTPLGTNGVYTTEDTLVASIYYRRQFTPYRWETLYLPFEVDRVTVLEDGVEYDLTAWDIFYGGHYFLAKPDGMLNKEILFGFTDELESHTPYIIQFSDAYYTDKLITFYGKESWNKLSTSFEVLSSSSWMQIAGNTTMQDQLLEKPVYMLRSGLDFILQKTTTTLHPFECYVMPYTAQSGAPARMSVRMRDDVATAVESVKGNESHLTYTVDGYTLTVYPQGQAFSIYSLNGALIYSCEAGKEAVDCELNSGCYLLHAGTEAHKIML